MLSVVSAFQALLQGFRYCLFEQAVRRHAMRPWLIGAFAYIVLGTAAYYTHGSLVSLMVDPPQVWWNYIVWGAVWLLAALLLLVGVVVGSFVAVMVIGGIFQTYVAQSVLDVLNVSYPGEGSGVKAAVSEVGRTVAVETGKLVWLLPISILAFIIGLVPLLAPVALVVGAMLLSYQFSDVVLDLYRIPLRERFALFRGQLLPLTAYGLFIALICLIPLVGILIPPVAVAGVTWLLKDLELVPVAETTAL